MLSVCVPACTGREAKRKKPKDGVVGGRRSLKKKHRKHERLFSLGLDEELFKG